MPNSFQPADESGSTILSFTGERYTPETQGNIYLEHMHRYLMVSDLVMGKDVLDIASGEGFGSYAMSQRARSVVGVDIDASSVEHALRRYKRPNVDFRSGSCSDIPLEDDSVDVVVSFETIEHHDEHDRMMQEVRRVLRPGGVFIISSPEKHEYTDVPGTRNPYHVKELYRDEFQSLMRANFRNVALYGQRVVFGSAIFLEGAPSHVKTTDSHTLEDSDGLARPIYLIAIASDAELPKLPASSLFEEDVLNSEVVGVKLQHLKAEREEAQQSTAHLQALADARQSVIEALEARRQRSLRKRIKKGLRSAKKDISSFFNRSGDQQALPSSEEPMASGAADVVEKKPEIELLFPIGHFYSPIADPEDIQSRRDVIFRPRSGTPGVDYRIDDQLALIKTLAPHVAQIDYPTEKPSDPTTYFYGNDQYPVLDADFLYAALCHFRPKNMIEVGSGFSSLITADVNRRVLDGAINFTCVEPYPRQFLLDGVDGISQLVVSKVEDLELSFFDQLGDGDLLFIDSSHVSKVGSDVNYLFFEVIPRLRPGVMVHIHDIFLPDEYPEQWALHQNRNWNEQYVLQAFMQYNSEWNVLWAAHLMGTRHTKEVRQVFSRYPDLGGGGSFWIQRR
jgi:SAM-dependent methyltransferase